MPLIIVAKMVLILRDVPEISINFFFDIPQVLICLLEIFFFFFLIDRHSD